MESAARVALIAGLVALWGCHAAAVKVPSEEDEEGATAQGEQRPDIAARDAFGKESCGVTGFMSEDEEVTETLLGQVVSKDRCEEMLRVNCTTSYDSVQCPEECKFIAPSPIFGCYFSCVRADRCSALNPDLTYPDETVRDHPMCTKCSVPLCKVCDTESTCGECHKGFMANDERTRCKLELDMTWLNIVVRILGVLVVLLLLLAFVWPCINGNHPRMEEHLVALHKARRHRHLSKACKWNLHDRKHIRTWWTLGENMHKANVAGVGLPLWYNSILFLMLVSLIFLCATYAVYRTSGASNTLLYIENHRGGNMVFETDSVLVSDRRPMVVASPLMHCSTWKFQDGLESLPSRMFVCVVFLYVVTFLLSLWFGRYQKKHTRWFDSENIDMADYCIRVTGLPVTEIDEASLRSELERMFRSVCPIEFPRPDIHKYRDEGDDEIEMVPPSQVEVECVSVGYEFFERKQEVDDALWKMMELQELELYERAKDVEQNAKVFRYIYLDRAFTIADTSLYDPNRPDMTTQEAHEEIQKKVAPLFEGENKLLGSGTAFAVFKYVNDKEAVMEAANMPENQDKLKFSDGTPLRLREVHSEPPCISWWSIGFSHEKLKQRMVVALGKILLLIMALQMFISLPYYLYIQKPYQDVGSKENGLITGVYGIVISNLNGILFATIYGIGEGIGFPLKDQLFSFVAVATCLFVLILNTLNILLNARLVAAQNAGIPLGVDIGFSEAIYSMLPGMFFAGSIMKVIVPTIQYVWNQSLAKIVYVWKCLPDPFLNVLVKILPWNPGSIDRWPFRNAEKMANPWEIPVMGDYADFVAIPTLCFFMLAFKSSWIWHVYKMMFFWCVFNYLYFRYTHLRYHGLNFYSSSRLNSIGMFLWGLALSTVAAQIPHWAIEAGYIDNSLAVRCVAIAATFAASFVLWVASYNFFVNPFDGLSVREDDVGPSMQEEKWYKVFDWLNCNPVYALKCRYFFQDIKGQQVDNRRKGHPMACGENPEVVNFYEVGKEYLFLKPNRQHLMGVHVSNFLEPEYWVDVMMFRIGQLVEMLRPASRRAADEPREETMRITMPGDDTEGSLPL